MSGPWQPALALWLASAAAAFALALAACGLALRVGLVDDASDAPDRKRHRAPVPLIGGVTILGASGLLLVSLVPAAGLLGPWDTVELGEALVRAFWPPGPELAPPWLDGVPVFIRVVPALGLAVLVGLVDDFLPRGLPAHVKLAGQLAAGLALAWFAQPDLRHDLGGQVEGWSFAAVVLGAVAAMNALNTFDNSDGAAVTLAAGAFLAASSLLAPIVLALLPLALVRRRGAPLAWLGDSGSHALGILLFAHPLTWPALFLPALDLARVAWLRARAGEPPWRGDRRHLAHRIEARGRSRFAVCAWLAPIGLAPVAGWVAAARGGPAWAAWAGFALGALLFAGALHMHPPEPCPAPRAER